MGAKCAKDDTTSSSKVEDNSKSKSEERKNTPPKEKRELKIYTMDDVAKSECWMVVDGYVVDCTGFDKDHPGGAYAIVQYAKKDATDIFLSSHGKRGVAKMKALAIGTIDGYKDIGKQLADIN
ncbi:predicted protein [Naegleria gruberi]|uniref:Predicted protein n=1 Tax=Naegleria gruberi TaxID=5762 RepID=D2W074_NAEGR|nr:uncharacterized protein NAEGRDRAFT_74757 [Naegleria gruberi]EFC37522.1 predicted protein [Naegleria gruberi]|eukprot:XP_002670266.1 predicted protein [Naegleria gruberi strain NEG-M]